ncbi:DUF3574 domain-containing protein [Pectobacterium carotovorum]|uniref:DUF3574 domain-containing protein n=1 Tax=Pectobacterium carotovorum TaxID=554 RepID=UPI00050481F0|nr:DUF3574 domain-containing protein [Pectobacterium carotovorum]KFW98160.1 ribosomal protein S3 [Pectobacterium carotovorum subsp. carotovorum]KML67670.1 ribosomal protein S3 [Pectobacterium carotovorum subsp. carotovorum ICMP 5702]SHH54907.1 Protein of unknown function [Pectobacterium carotovorum]
MKQKIIAVSLLLGTLLVSGCNSLPRSSVAAAPATDACQIGDKQVQTTLYFGLNRPAGPAISDAEWKAFLDSDVTPRFKEGLTVFDAKGQWLGNDGVVARENSKALMLIHGPDRERDIEALRTTYKSRFAQESVMRIDAPVCVAF